MLLTCLRVSPFLCYSFQNCIQGHIQKEHPKIQRKFSINYYISHIDLWVYYLLYNMWVFCVWIMSIGCWSFNDTKPVSTKAQSFNRKKKNYSLSIISRKCLFGYAIITWLLLSKFIANKCFDAVFLFSYINHQTVMYIPRREKTFSFQLFSLYLVSGKAMKNPSTCHAIQPCEAFFENIHDSKIRDCGEEVLKNL